MASSQSIRKLMTNAKASPRLTHPYAHYSIKSGALSCSLCGTGVKHDALFAAHLGSKSHRVKAAKREQEEQGRKRVREVQEEPREEAAKRSRLDDDVVNVEVAVDVVDESPSEPTRKSGPALPEDFFDDPSMAPAPSAPSPSPSTEPEAKLTEEDPDWLDFSRDVLGDGLTQPTKTRLPDLGDARFTITAEPVMYKAGGPDEEVEEAEVELEETAEEKRERLDREEREEMMSRLEEEEREQMEADERVAALKRRLELLKKARSGQTGAGSALSKKP